MFQSRRVVAAAFAVVACHLLAPMPAAGQLGGLVKKAKKATEAKAESTLPFTPQPAPEFSDRVLEITEERLAGLLRGFEAEAAHARTAAREYEERVRSTEAALAAHERAREAWDRDIAKYQGCAAEFHDAEAKAAAANEAELEKVLAALGDEAFAAYAERLALRGLKVSQAVQAGQRDPATMRELEAFQREVAVMQKEQMRRVNIAMAASAAERERQRTENPRLVQACGPEPKAPVRPDDVVGGPEGILLQHGSEAAALDGQDPSAAARLSRYTIMRERVIAWVAEKQRPRSMGFSPDEIQTLEAQAKAVNQAVDRMRKAGVSL